MRRLLICLISLTLILVGCSQKSTEVIKPEINSVYYEVFVGSFYDSDGDGMGDLKGVEEKLDYIQYDLGATGIWFMPIHSSDTYHKYDVSDYYSIDSAYGTMEDFESLVAEMNKRDMDLIMDLVLNHTSTKHQWFQKAITDNLNNQCTEINECNYYNFSSEYIAGYHQLTNNLWYEGVFWDQMPDLNLDNSLLREEIVDIIDFWLDKGIKGFRLDATTHFYERNQESNIEFLRWLNTEVKSIKPDAYIVGEAWSGESIILDMARSGIDSFFNFSFSQNSGNIVKAIRNENGNKLAQQIVDYNKALEESNDKVIDAVFLSNHDNDRSAGYLIKDEDKKLAANIYLLMPGNVFVYYGEEVGLKGSGIDENKRLPILWNKDGVGVTTGPKDATYQQKDPIYVDEALKDKDSLLNHYKRVISLRNQHSEISRNSVEIIDLNDDRLAVLDYGSIVIVHNLSKENVSFELEYQEVIAIQNEAKINGNTIVIDGKQSLIIKR